MVAVPCGWGAALGLGGGGRDQEKLNRPAVCVVGVYESRDRTAMLCTFAGRWYGSQARKHTPL